LEGGSGLDAYGEKLARTVVMLTFLSGVGGGTACVDEAVKTSSLVAVDDELAVVDERGTILGMTTSSYAPTGLMDVRALSRGSESSASAGADGLGEGDGGAATGGGIGRPGDAVAAEPEGDGRTFADRRSRVPNKVV